MNSFPQHVILGFQIQKFKYSSSTGTLGDGSCSGRYFLAILKSKSETFNQSYSAFDPNRVTLLWFDFLVAP